MSDLQKLSISLFSCGGIGDLALHSAGIKTLVSNELLEDRHQVFKFNNPGVRCITGDIRIEKRNIIDATNELLNGRELNFLYATPPCQGMSKNGRGKLLNAIRSGLKPEIDERNLLIIPTMEIAIELNPETVILENVPEMYDTEIPVNGNLVRIVDFVAQTLGNSYVGRGEVVEFANYGVPQRRQRLITIFTRNKSLSDHYNHHGTFFPPETHSQNSNVNPWVTVRDTISHLPKLDAKSKKTAEYPDIPMHKVPLLDEDKYFWVSNTPAEKGAFDNQCAKCGNGSNSTHGSNIGIDGINRSNRDTPIYCNKCHSLLPRPWVKENGEYRLMKGFTSAYKRMSWDQPSPALTRNISYACSDNKLHPEQNRVLSLYEACLLHTITDYNYKWIRADGKNVSDKLIRELIGESIPPRGLEVILNFILQTMVSKGKIQVSYPRNQRNKPKSRQIDFFKMA